MMCRIVTRPDTSHYKILFVGMIKMNAAAFRRGEALTRLENYAPVIVEHLALAAWYPSHPANSHWKVELAAFKKTIIRYNTSKGKKPNFTRELVIDALQPFIDTDEERDYLLIGVESHGVTLNEHPNWADLQTAIEKFAAEIAKN